MSKKLKASEKIPVIARPFVSERALKTLDIVEKFVEEECIPADVAFTAMLGSGAEKRFTGHPQVVDDLKDKAKKLGLWNLFLPKAHFTQGAGFSNLEYGLMAEYLGRSVLAPEATNCNAPDTGNMELLAKYGSDAQKKKWLEPLLAGEIRSAFLMTEPKVASSDPTNLEMTMHKEGNEWVLNGQKWWITGAGDERCKIYIIVSKSNADHEKIHKRHSVLLVPHNTPGINVKRVLSVFGYDDAPHGHAHIFFDNVRVPAENMVLGPGQGFEILQGRLGPGRIHHAMRSVGSAERALDLFLARANDPAKRPFGKYLSEHGVMLDRIARSRIEIDAARLIVCNAAIKMDESDAKGAMAEIAETKILVPQTLLDVLDRAIQAYGAGGISQDTPLAAMWANGRTMRLVDGPDEVHVQQLGKNENKRAAHVREALAEQEKRSEALLRKYGVEKRDPLELNRKYGPKGKL